MSGRGLAEAEVEPAINCSNDVVRVVAVRTRFQSYATSGNTTAEDCEAQGQALVDAARFVRVVLAAVSQRPSP